MGNVNEIVKEELSHGMELGHLMIDFLEFAGQLKGLSHHRGVAMMSYRRGKLAKPLHSGVRSTLSGPPGQEKLKHCRSDTMKRKSSMRARDSPTQDRFPGR